MKSKSSSALPIPVKSALNKLGQDIKHARQRRRISTEIMSQRASISRSTLNKVEKGDPNVLISTYAMVLFVLGMIHSLAVVADSKNDSLGLSLEEEQLPKRIRARSIKPPKVLVHQKKNE